MQVLDGITLNVVLLVLIGDALLTRFIAASQEVQLLAYRKQLWQL